jgi:hypothetical protein
MVKHTVRRETCELTRHPGNNILQRIVLIVLKYYFSREGLYRLLWIWSDILQYIYLQFYGLMFSLA